MSKAEPATSDPAVPLRAVSLGVVTAQLSVLALLTLAPILLNLPGTGGLPYDAVTFHLPQINYFLHHPGDLLHYPATATTLPFYHWLIAQIAALDGFANIDNASLLPRLTHWAISVAGPAVAVIVLVRRCGALNGGMLALPLVTSWYFIGGMVFYGTDGPGHSLLLLALAGGTAAGFARPAVLMALIVATRHMLLPFVAASYGAQALFARRAAPIAKVALAAVPALVILAIYIAAWGGLVPPGMVRSLNPKGVFLYAPLGHLGIMALWGSAYGVLRLKAWWTFLAERRVQAALAIGAVIVALVWLAVPTDPSTEGGRFGSVVWSLARIGLVGQHSRAVLALALWGWLTLALFARDCLAAGETPVEAAAIAALIAALALTYASYERYSEPAIIAALAFGLARRLGRARLPLYQYAPLAVFSLAALGLTLHNLLA